MNSSQNKFFNHLEFYQYLKCLPTHIIGYLLAATQLQPMVLGAIPPTQAIGASCISPGSLYVVALRVYASTTGRLRTALEGYGRVVWIGCFLGCY